ncbi:helicase HerA-like domain-containing protein [Shigella flexneri]
MGPVTGDERNGLIHHSSLYGKYEEDIDRESAYERCRKVCRPVPSSGYSSRQW